MSRGLDPGTGRADSPSVFAPKPDRPFLDAWLRRTSKQFATSGRLSQTAAVLAREEGGSADEWSARLRRILDGEETPSIELLTRIDRILAGPGGGPAAPPRDSQGSLF